MLMGTAWLVSLTAAISWEFLTVLLFVALLGLTSAPPQTPEPTFFAKLADATERHDQKALLRLLATQRLSTARGTVGPDNDIHSGKLTYEVTASAIAAKLSGCFVKLMNDDDGPANWLGPFVLWHCPAEQAPENPCWFYTYRGAMFQPTDRPKTLLFVAMPARDKRCGPYIPPPPPPPPAYHREQL